VIESEEYLAGRCRTRSHRTEPALDHFAAPARAAEGGAVRTVTAAALTAEVLPVSDPGQGHEVLIRTGTITTVTDVHDDRPAPRFCAAIS
jgi:hypothetical protein